MEKTRAIRTSHRHDYSRLHEVAAVMSSFTLPELQKLQTSGGDVDALLFDSAPVHDPQSPGRWTLQPAVRAAVLGRMSSIDEMRAAVGESSSVAPGDDPLRRALNALLQRSSSIEALDIPSLSALSPLAPLLQRVVPDLPARDDLERRLEYLRLLEPFERLVGTHFAGRRTELQQLRDYVDVLPPASALAAVARYFFKRKAPLLIYGAGGVGKSTLMAKFILEHARLPEADRFPFAYLDFDRPLLMASEPATILVEAVRQIGLQYPAACAAADRLREQWTERLESSGRRRGTKSSGSADATARGRVLKDFVQFLETLEVIRGPLLLVLDTFEEVQYRSVYVRELVKFLDALSEAVPRLRTVLSGRAVVPKIKTEKTIALQDFDEDAAVGFLTQPEQGVEPALARLIVKQVGGNPLTLRLAAAVAHEKDETTSEGIRGLETHTGFGLIRVKKAHIQGQLFRRILEHIKNEDVKQIAHPGLVLRRVTPDLIRRVLAGPCQIEVATMERAEELFRALQREVALVSPAGKNVVEHRVDVRRLMLADLRETKPRETREIDELAASYYAQEPGAVARAEEIYHRLALAEPHDEIAKLFLDGVEELLANAIDELPAPEKAFLAERLHVDLPPDAIEGASQQVWERAAIRRVQEALDADSPASAIEVLSERTERSAQTMLRVHEVLALTAAGHLVDAARRAAEATEAYASEGNLLGVFETVLADAEIARRSGDGQAALQKLEYVEHMAQQTRNDLQMIRVLVARSLTYELTGDNAPDTRAAIAKIAAKVDDETWKDEPVLLRLAAACSLDAKLIARALRLVGWTRIAERQRRALMSTFDVAMIDEHHFAAMLETGSTTLGQTGVVAGILRNDTHAELEYENRPSINVGVDASAEEISHAISRTGIPRPSLARVLETIDQSIDSLSFDESTMIDSVVRYAIQQGWIARLIDALRRTVPLNIEFQLFADRLGLGLTIEQLRGDSIPREVLHALVENRRPDLLKIESRICRIEREERLVGTGFLISRGRVLTSEQALSVRDDTIDLHVRFDAGEKDGRLYAPGNLARVLKARRLDVASSNASAVVLELGLNFLGPEAPMLTTAESFVPPDGPLIWIWHENGLRIGGTAQVLRGDQTQIGFPVRPRNLFAGAPCFDMDLRLVAVHCGAHRRLKKECVARPVSELVDLINAQALTV